GRRAARRGLVGGTMSRIGRKPVPLPKGVTAQVTGRTLLIKGPKGEITRTFHPTMAITVEENAVIVRRPSDEHFHKALHGLSRTLVANMVAGVTDGFRKQLEIQEIGRASCRERVERWVGAGAVKKEKRRDEEGG